ncbi:MAG: hypothetical protein HND52_19820, partial [Ignavibacteriae bacterium]|nr:hypothetical protein [Ignavibacteriota bacterium]NOH00217.1 hypothetical protein [Ignavibacteriota bacterium]
NGKTWKSLRGSINSSETGRLTKVAYDGKTCCIVGSNDGKAILYLGKR